jgi:hypothetical protein
MDQAPRPWSGIVRTDRWAGGSRSGGCRRGIFLDRTGLGKGLHLVQLCAGSSSGEAFGDGEGEGGEPLGLTKYTLQHLLSLTPHAETAWSGQSPTLPAVLCFQIKAIALESATDP